MLRHHLIWCTGCLGWGKPYPRTPESAFHQQESGHLIVVHVQVFTYQQNEDVDAGEDVLVDLMTEGAVNHSLLRHGDRIPLTSAHDPAHDDRERYRHGDKGRHTRIHTHTQTHARTHTQDPPAGRGWRSVSREPVRGKILSVCSQPS